MKVKVYIFLYNYLSVNYLILGLFILNIPLWTDCTDIVAKDVEEPLVSGSSIHKNRNTEIRSYRGRVRKLVDHNYSKIGSPSIYTTERERNTKDARKMFLESLKRKINILIDLAPSDLSSGDEEENNNNMINTKRRKINENDNDMDNDMGNDMDNNMNNDMDNDMDNDMNNDMGNDMDNNMNNDMDNGNANDNTSVQSLNQSTQLYEQSKEPVYSNEILPDNSMDSSVNSLLNAEKKIMHTFPTSDLVEEILVPSSSSSSLSSSVLTSLTANNVTIQHTEEPERKDEPFHFAVESFISSLRSFYHSQSIDNLFYIKYFEENISYFQSLLIVSKLQKPRCTGNQSRELKSTLMMIDQNSEILFSAKNSKSVWDMLNSIEAIKFYVIISNLHTCKRFLVNRKVFQQSLKLTKKNFNKIARQGIAHLKSYTLFNIMSKLNILVGNPVASTIFDTIKYLHFTINDDNEEIDFLEARKIIDEFSQFHLSMILALNTLIRRHHYENEQLHTITLFDLKKIISEMKEYTSTWLGKLQNVKVNLEASIMGLTRENEILLIEIVCKYFKLYILNRVLLQIYMNEETESIYEVSESLIATLERLQFAGNLLDLSLKHSTGTIIPSHKLRIISKVLLYLQINFLILNHYSLEKYISMMESALGSFEINKMTHLELFANMSNARTVCLSRLNLLNKNLSFYWLGSKANKTVHKLQQIFRINQVFDKIKDIYFNYHGLKDNNKLNELDQLIKKASMFMQDILRSVTT